MIRRRRREPVPAGVQSLADGHGPVRLGPGLPEPSIDCPGPDSNHTVAPVVLSQVSVVEGEPEQLLAAKTGVDRDGSYCLQLALETQGLKLLDDLGKHEKTDVGRRSIGSGRVFDRIDGMGGMRGRGAGGTRACAALRPGLKNATYQIVTANDPVDPVHPVKQAFF